MAATAQGDRAVKLAGRAFQMALALLLALGAAGAAQAADDLGPPSTAAERCLSPAVDDRARPDYPAAASAAGGGVFVRARYTFTAPDRAPAVTLTDAGHDVEAAVRNYAQQLRVPCMGAGDPPVILQQDFDFVPNDGRKVALSLPLDVSSGKSMDGCNVSRSDKSGPGPLYPAPLLKFKQEGGVVVRLRFVDPAQGPEVTVLDDGGSELFVQSVRANVEGLRLSCPDKRPRYMQIRYSFVIDPMIHRVLLHPELTLAQVVNAAKPDAPGSVYFDTTLMQCPFDVRMTYAMPWSRNHVDEVGKDVPARHVFLDWLSTLEFAFKPSDANRIVGQKATVHVPCTKLDF